MAREWLWLAVCAVLGYGGWQLYSASADPFIASCEAEIRARMGAPSTYVRINADANSIVQSSDEYRASQETEILNSGKSPDVMKAEREILRMDVNDIKAGKFVPILKVAKIEYDAANAYGVPIRSVSTCEYRQQSTDKNVRDHAVKVDGLDHFEYMAMQIKALKGK